MQTVSVDLREVGVAQRRMVWAILAWLPGFFPPFLVITLPFQLVCVYKLSRALKLGAGVTALFMLLVWVPFVCLLALLAINARAMDVLRSAGIRVGWMGACVDDLPPESVG